MFSFNKSIQLILFNFLSIDQLSVSKLPDCQCVKFVCVTSPQVTVPLPGSQLSLPNFGSGGGQPLLALPPTPPQAQPNMNRQPPVSQAYRGIMGPNHNMMQPPTSKVL